MRALAWLAALPMVLSVLAGCAGSGPSVVDPYEDADYVSGRTIHLKMKVVDYDQQVYPGLKTWLWAFCVEPFDASDTVSASVIEYLSRLPGDGTNRQGDERDHCGVPGPTIHVQQGDHVIVEFTNEHVHPHTIHWHGQYVAGTDCPAGKCADGAQGVSQEAVLKGTSYTYDFLAKRAGTLWYHCHVDAGFHVMQGLYGMFIVDPHSKAHEPDVDHEERLVLGTLRRATVEAVPGTNRHNHPPGCYVSGTPDCQNPPQDLTPDVFLLNGHSYPYTEDQAESTLHIAQGKTVRLRLLNAGTTVEQIHLHGHDMEVIAQDGVMLAIPYYVDTLPIGPAQRFDVLIHGNNPGVWLLHTHVAGDEANDLQFPGGMHTMLVYDGFADHVHDFPAEAGGGMAYHADAFPPPDRAVSDTVALSTSLATGVPGAPPPAAGASAQRTFPITMECAAVGIQFQAHLDGSAAALAATQLHLVMSDPKGQVHFEADLGRDAGNAQAVHTLATHRENQSQATDGTFLLPQGNWTVTLSGSAAETTVSLSTYIDYYGSWAEQIEHHHRYLTPLCGSYGYGNGGREVGPPPI